MPAHGSGVSAADLKRAARSAGFEVTADQLRRWHLAGALPRPRQVSLGRPRGTVTIYPAKTERHVIRLCELHRHEKRLAQVTWTLWWEGYEVAPPVARDFLAVVARQLDDTVNKVRLVLADDAAAASIFEASISTRIRSALARQVRKRVGRQRFPQAMELLLRIAIGSFTGFAPYSEDQEVLDAGLGLDRARRDRLYEAPAWIDDSEEPLVQLSRLLKDASFETSLRDSNDDELETARSELRQFMTLMDNLGRTTNRRFGRGTFGMVLFGVGRFLGVEDYARLCLLWLHIRRSTEMQAGMTQILAAAPAVDGLVRTSTAIDVLAAEIPAFKPLLMPAKMRAAARNKAVRARHLRDIRATYEANQDAVEMFKQRHPELLINGYAAT